MLFYLHALGTLGIQACRLKLKPPSESLILFITTFGLVDSTGMKLCPTSVDDVSLPAGGYIV